MESAEVPQPLHPSQSDMAESLPQIIWTARPDGTVDWINHEFESYTGISNADVAAGGWLLSMHPDDREPTRKVWEQAIAGSVAYRTEFRLWCAAKEGWRRHLVDARPHLDAAGKLTRWYGIAIDIQDLRDAEALREAELRLQIVQRRALEKVAAGEPLSHILKDIGTGMTDVVKGTTIAIALAEDGHFSDSSLGNATQEEQRRAGRVQIPVRGASGADIIAWVVCEHDRQFVPTDAEIALLHRLAEFVGTVISQVQNRDLLRASDHRFRSLFDFLPVAIWEEDITGILTMLDKLKAEGVVDLAGWLDQNPAFAHEMLTELRVLDANRAVQHLYGLPDRDPETLSQVTRRLMLDPAFGMALRGMLIAAWEGRSELETSYVISRPDGSKADLLVRMLMPEPGSGRLLVTEFDITAQRRAEERFRHVAHASSDYIFDRDFDRDTTWVSDAASWLPGYAPGPCEVPRNAWVDSVHPDDKDEILMQINAAISGGEHFWEGEYQLRQRDGSYIPVLERASILRNDSGEPTRMIGNIINLSKQKALEAELHQSQRLDAVGQLTGGIAHDFNNLLTVILGNAEILAETLPFDQPSATTARQIMIASERAAELTQRMLAFARRQPLSPGAFDANAMIQDMRMLIERSITPAITLELNLAENLRAVQVDRAMFESALLNLCVNARDAMPNGGMLRIETSAHTLAASTGPDAPEAGEYVRIVVSDTGEGMDGNTMSRVFEPFFSTKPPGQGSGLGLSMVHGFARQSGGDVGIQSGLGTGTAVALLLPVHHQPAAIAGVPEVDPVVPPTVPRARILVVEDEDQVRTYISTLLQSLGYEVETEPRAAPALARLRAGEPFDLLLSDIVMPGGLSGRQLAQTVLTERQGLPVLLVSGHAEEIGRTDGQLDPRIGFLRKPFRKGDLAHRLAEMLPG